MSNYKIQDNYLICGNEKKATKSVKFSYPIDKLVEFNLCYVVSIEPPVKDIFNENVFGISKSGEIIWQLEAIPHVYENSPYTGMAKDGDLVKLYNWDGTNLVVEPMTGKIISKGFSK